jgi:hypothetical protein
MKISSDFVEKLMILVLTAILTGFLVPYILTRVDAAKSKEQKLFEADVARQAKLIDAQAKFLDDITEALWQWRYLSIRVTFHADDSAEERYTASVKDYEGKIWDTLSKLRNEISKSRRLYQRRRISRSFPFMTTSPILTQSLLDLFVQICQGKNA